MSQIVNDFIRIHRILFFKWQNTYRRGGQTKDRAVLNVAAILWRITRTQAEVSVHFRPLYPPLGYSSFADEQTFSVM